jgi:hypothetical protein
VIEVNLDNPSEKVRAITLLDICDVDDYLSCASCESTERSSGLKCLVSEQENGCMSVWLRDFFDDNLIEEGNGPILTISCDISSSALPGECRDLNPGNGYIANELDIYVDAIVESGEFCFLSKGTIIIGECDTGVVDKEIEEGLTMSDLIDECAISADGKQGKFASCVSKLTNEWKKEGLINGREKGAIQSCVGQ